MECSSTIAFDSGLRAREIPLDGEVSIDHVCSPDSGVLEQNTSSKQGTSPSSDIFQDESQSATQAAIIDAEVVEDQAGSPGSISKEQDSPSGLNASKKRDITTGQAFSATQTTVTINEVDPTGNQDRSADPSIPPVATQTEHPDESVSRRDQYLQFPATRWNEAAFGPWGLLRDQDKEAWENETLWNEFLGRFWMVSADNRIDLSFQKHVLRCIPPDIARDILAISRRWLQSMDRNSPGHISAASLYIHEAELSIHDYGQGGKSLHYVPSAGYTTCKSLGSKLDLISWQVEGSVQQIAEDFGFPMGMLINASELTVAPWRRFMYVP